MDYLEFGSGDVIQATDQVFLVDKVLGSGGIACVYLCRQPKMGNRKVVLKILQGKHAFNAEVRQAFEREPQAMARIRHKSVVEIYDRGFTGDEYRRPFFIMEFVPGESLRDVLKSLTKLPELVAVGVGIELAEGIHYMHKAGVLHCDIKPENVFIIVGEGGVGVAKLMDFGGIVMMDESPRIARLFTPRYAAPEVLRVQEISDKSDVFSFGLMLYEIVSGVTPFQGKAHTMEACVDRVGLPVPPLSDHGRFNADLVELVSSMLAIDPERRPKALEVGRKLQRIHRQVENQLGDVHARQTMRNLTQVRHEESKPIRVEDYQVSTTPDPVDHSIFGFAAEPVDAHAATTPSPSDRNQETRPARPPAAALAVAAVESAPNPSLDHTAATRPPKKPLPAPDYTGLRIAEATPEAKKESVIDKKTLDIPLTLVVRAPGKARARHVITELPCLLGRDDVHVVIPHGSVSNRHAAIIWRREKIQILDLGSRNGTLVNGKKMADKQTVELADGVRISIGDADIDVEIGERPGLRRLTRDVPWVYVVGVVLLVSSAVFAVRHFRSSAPSTPIAIAATSAPSAVSTAPIASPQPTTMSSPTQTVAVPSISASAVPASAPTASLTPTVRSTASAPLSATANDTDFLRKIGGGL